MLIWWETTTTSPLMISRIPENLVWTRHAITAKHVVRRQKIIVASNIIGHHDTKDCDRLNELIRTNSSLKFFLRKFNLKVWNITGTITQVDELFANNYRFYMDKYPRQPFFCFNYQLSLFEKIFVEVLVYPMSDLKPSQMTNLFVYSIEQPMLTHVHWI